MKIEVVTFADTPGTPHTKSPWRAEGPDWCGDYNILHPADSLAVAAVVSNMRGPNEIAANARLIAASPDLLEACRAAKAFLIKDLEEPGRTVFWQLVAALRKASESQP